MLIKLLIHDSSLLRNKILKRIAHEHIKKIIIINLIHKLILLLIKTKIFMINKVVFGVIIIWCSKILLICEIF